MTETEVLVERVHAIERMLEERDRRYMEQFQASKDAVSAALTAAKELTAQAFAASEKAITESKKAQEDVNAKSNEFRGQLKDQNDTMIPRPEANARFNSIDEKIEDTRKNIGLLREAAVAFPSRNEVSVMLQALTKDISDLRDFRNTATGRDRRDEQARQSSQWGVGVAIAGALAVVGLIIGVIEFLLRAKP